jgi:hypothetical protein
MDNRYYQYGCPPLMQDARFITNYLQNRIVEQYIRNINKIDSAQDYKNFLQKNGAAILDREFEFFTKNNTCNVNGRCLPIPERADLKNNCPRK